jgi:predicted glycosyltransferase
MRILIDINHPAHVHLFKNFAWEMKKKGHVIFFTTRKKEVSIDLLEKFGFDYKSFGIHYKSMFGKFWGFIKFDWKMLVTALRFKPDLFLTMGGMYASHIAFILRKPHIALDDTEHARSHHMLYVPFTNVCMNPTCFHKSFGKKQIFYRGYHELAYMHPKRFKPDPNICKTMGLKENEKYFLIRFVSWAASHDIGQSGISEKVKVEFVKALSKYARVFISSEGKLIPEFEHYRLKIEPHRMHDVLAFASLYIGEGSTMASEAACIGTPAIYINSLEVGYCTEQEKYGLVFNFRNIDGALEKTLELVRDHELEAKSKAGRDKMLSEKIDVTAFLVWFVENYPESFNIMKNDPDYDKRFIGN